MPRIAIAFLWMALHGVTAPAEEASDARKLADRALLAVGGADKVPDIVSWKERWYLGESQKGNDREAVIRFPNDWFEAGKNIAQGNDDRAEKASMVGVWALWPLKDQKTQLAALPAVEVNGQPADGLRVSRPGKKEIDLYFDRATGRLARMDWRAYRVFFENWQQADGYAYPAKAHVRNADGSLYLWTEFLEFKPLKELPAGLAP